MTISRRGRVVRGLAFAGVAAAGYAFGISSDRAAAQPGQPGLPGTPTLQPPKGTPAPQPAALPQGEPDRRVAAYIYGNVPITRADLGEFLISRGGYEKLELLVNKKIIEHEAGLRGVSVTAIEVQAGLEEDLRGLGISRADFEKHVLPRYNKSLYEWVEDVIKPRILLSKMCRDRVKIGEEDLKRAFENRYGEQRRAQVICWNKTDAGPALRHAQKQWDEARKGTDEFNAVARQMADPALAANLGRVQPVGRYSETADPKIEQTLFRLKVGEISELLDTPSGIMCMKLTEIIPADDKVKFDDAMKATLTREMAEKRLNAEVGKFFQELKERAKPQLYLKGPPTAAEFREGVQHIINQAGGVPPGALPK